MAVSTLHNTRGVYGLPAQYDVVIEEYGSGEASSAISAGMVVTLTTAGLVVRAATGATTANIQLVGVALDDVAAGQNGKFLTKGLAANLVIYDTTNPAANDLLTGPVTTTGRAGKLTAAATSQGQGIGFTVNGATQAAGLAIPLAYISKF